MTKCNFHKYGPSGTIQTFDALCVMALNIVNEKIYTFLWFWFLILFILTLFVSIWRIISLIMHRNVTFSKIVFSLRSHGKLDIKGIVRRLSYSDWLYLVYLSKNLDPLVFKRFINYMNNTQIYPSLYAETDSIMK